MHNMWPFSSSHEPVGVLVITLCKAVGIFFFATTKETGQSHIVTNLNNHRMGSTEQKCSGSYGYTRKSLAMMLKPSTGEREMMK